MKTVAQKINIYQPSIVKILAAMVILLMFAYLYFVNSTAFAAASYEQLDSQINQTQSKIGQLELNLIQARRSINREMADEFALVSIDESEFAFARRNVATRLTINE